MSNAKGGTDDSLIDRARLPHSKISAYPLDLRSAFLDLRCADLTRDKEFVACDIDFVAIDMFHVNTEDL